MSHVCGWTAGPSYPTIDSLFDAVQHAITREPDQLTVSYDNEFGYPRTSRLTIATRQTTSTPSRPTLTPLVSRLLAA